MASVRVLIRLTEKGQREAAKKGQPNYRAQVLELDLPDEIIDQMGIDAAGRFVIPPSEEERAVYKKKCVVMFPSWMHIFDKLPNSDDIIDYFKCLSETQESPAKE